MVKGIKIFSVKRYKTAIYRYSEGATVARKCVTVQTSMSVSHVATTVSRPRVFRKLNCYANANRF